MFRRVMPSSGIATETGIVALRFYAAYSTAGSRPVTGSLRSTIRIPPRARKLLPVKLQLRH
jgi:hypothetical protein